jgi:uncharacterized membrane protein YfhO
MMETALSYNSGVSEARRDRPLPIALIAAACSAVILSAAFKLLDISPFGDVSMIRSDLAEQYLPFLAWFQDIVHGDAGLLYSFSAGIGENALPLFAYYLCSPFNLLVLPFARENLPYAIALIVYLKIACSSGMMAFCLRKLYPRAGWAALPIAVSWSLSGFVAMYFFNIIWLDVMIWLPLAVYGLHRLFERKRPGVYIAALFLMIVSNYYMAYMACLFLLLYGVSALIGKRAYLSIPDFFRSNRVPIALFAASTAIAAGLAAVLLVPAAAGMLDTGKASFDPIVFAPKIRFGLDGLASFTIGSGTFELRHRHLPTLFIGAFPLISAMMYFRCGGIARRQRVLSAVLLILLGLSLWFRPFAIVFQMFQPAVGFPHRQAFLPVFLLCLIACRAWAAGREEAAPLPGRCSLLRIAAIGLVALAAAALFSEWLSHNAGAIEFDRAFTPLNLKRVALSAALLLVTLLLLAVFRKYGGRARGASVILICLVLFAELGLNFYLTADSGSSMKLAAQRDFIGKYEEAAGGIDEDGAFFRADNRALYTQKMGISAFRSGYNDGFLINYPNVMMFSSTLSAQTVDLYRTLGLSAKSERRVSSLGSTELTDLLLDIKWEFYTEGDSFRVRENPAAIGSGFLCGPALLDDVTAPDPELTGYGAGDDAGGKQDGASLDVSPLDTQNRIVKAMSGDNRPLFTNNSISVKEEKQKAGKYKYRITMTMSADGVAYACLPKKGNTYSRISVNGTPLRSKGRTSARNPLRLGEFKRGEQVEVQLTATGKNRLDASHFRTLNRAVFEEFRARAAERSIELRYSESAPIMRGAALKGVIDAPEDALLFLSLPYDKRWHIAVNDKNAETLLVLNGLTAVKVAKGVNELSLKYEAKELCVGAAISAASLVCLIALAVALHRRRRNGV